VIMTQVWRGARSYRPKHASQLKPHIALYSDRCLFRTVYTLINVQDDPLTPAKEHPSTVSEGKKIEPNNSSKYTERLSMIRHNA
jgi:hypothetical protein